MIPDTEDIVGVFSRGTTGIGATGTYSISENASLGLGLQAESLSFSQESPEDDIPTNTNHFDRIVVTPFFAFDSTRGLGPQVRGVRLALSHSWIGRSLLRGISSTRESFQLNNFIDDPWTQGRNSVVFHLKGTATLGGSDSRSQLGGRLFPGAEYARGFRAGGFTAWATEIGAAAEPPQPAGADTALGFSAEYRIPIHERLSSTLFFDAGWSRVESNGESIPGEGLKVIAATNNVLRASVGGELRLDLPLIRQPGRLIFAWNPLRLDALINNGSSAVRFADPRGAVRFALGSLF